MKTLSALLTLVMFTALPAAASVTLGLDAGLLTDQNGNPISDGGVNAANGAGDLVLIIASPTGVFTPTVGSQFVSGDNFILASTGSVTGAFEMTDQNTTPGETSNLFTFDYGVGATGNSVTSAPSVVAGDKLAIRWYTNFTLAQFEAGQTPTSGYYGTYTTTALLPNNDGGAAWVAPADPGFYSGSNGLFFFTSNDPMGGDQSPVLGEALTPVTSTAVPEPTTYALLAIGMVVFLGVTIKRKRVACTV